MKKKEKILYWLTSADNDWRAVCHLFEKKDYAHSLFFAHLTLEKILKALYVAKHNTTPPFSHRLVYLAEKSELILNNHQIELLEIVTDFNMEVRYPDEKLAFYKKCTKKFTSKYIGDVGELKEWLKRQIK
ncbi:MAG TPA: HEPN domain-containing protein [Smithella sp.]|nr:HEPN domain-containing protein [Smithella sp.]